VIAISALQATRPPARRLLRHESAHDLQTIVYICDDREMDNSEQVAISITLSPTQVNEVVHAASQNRTPSISAQITNTLAGRSESIDSADPRLSRSLLRGLSLLTHFGPDGEPRGIVELAEEVGLSPSTTHRYLATLVEFGLLEQCPKSRKYRLPGV
jgi:predicted transcriptional regulator